MYRKKKTGIIGIIITIIILIFLVVITNTDIAKMSYVENIVSNKLYLIIETADITMVNIKVINPNIK